METLRTIELHTGAERTTMGVVKMENKTRNKNEKLQTTLRQRYHCKMRVNCKLQ
jgi:hypothetical protein